MDTSRWALLELASVRTEHICGLSENALDICVIFFWCTDVSPKFSCRESHGHRPVVFAASFFCPDGFSCRGSYFSRWVNCLPILSPLWSLFMICGGRCLPCPPALVLHLSFALKKCSWGSRCNSVWQKNNL